MMINWLYVYPIKNVKILLSTSDLEVQIITYNPNDTKNITIRFFIDRKYCLLDALYIYRTST